MHIKTADELRDLVKKALLAAGADERNAARVAQALVSADLRGMDSHGIRLVPRYVASIRDGDIVPTAWPETISETPTTALITGNWTFGHVTAMYATEVAMRKAGQQNVAVVSTVQTNHIGRLGEYTEMAAAQNMISIMSSSGYAEEDPIAVPYGGTKKILSTNPISMGFPGGEEPPMVLDFATTTMANQKVRLLAARKQPVPPGVLVDAGGNPTTDPAALLEAGGGLLPFGGHKGYALMLAMEFLGRIFSGADSFAEAHRGGAYMRHQGVTLLVFRADMHQPIADFVRRADEMERRARAVPPAPGFEAVMVPGDPETRTRVARQRDGIPIHDDVWDSLAEVASSLGVKLE